MQKAVGSIERDENYVPHLRGHYNLPPPERASRADYAEVFEETPAMTLFRMVVMQVLCVFSHSHHFRQLMSVAAVGGFT